MTEKYGENVLCILGGIIGGILVGIDVLGGIETGIEIGIVVGSWVGSWDRGWDPRSFTDNSSVYGVQVRFVRGLRTFSV